MDMYRGDDDCPDPNDTELFAEMDRDRTALMNQFDLSDGPEPHQRKDEVRLLLSVLDKPERMTQLLVMRACATPELLDGDLARLVMKPNGVRSSSQLVPILGEFGKSFPVRVKDQRWPRFGGALANAKEMLSAVLPQLALEGVESERTWRGEVRDAAWEFLSSSGDPKGTWPKFPESWRRWRQFIELDPGLQKAFYNQAKRYFLKNKVICDDLVAMIRDEVFLTGICNAEKRYAKSADLRGGILGQALKSCAKRMTNQILERSGNDKSKEANPASIRVQRVAISDEAWQVRAESSEKTRAIQQMLRDLKCECSDLEWMIWDCHYEGMKAPDIVAALQPIADSYEEIASALEAGNRDLHQHDDAPQIIPVELNGWLDLSSLADAMRSEANQLRLNEAGVRDVIHTVREKAKAIVDRSL